MAEKKKMWRKHPRSGHMERHICSFALRLEMDELFKKSKIHAQIWNSIAGEMEKTRIYCQSSSSYASSTDLSVCKDKDEENTNIESDSSGSESVAPPVSKKNTVAGRQKRKGNSILETLKEHSEKQINEMRRYEQFLQEQQDQRLARFDRLLDVLQNKKTLR
ncbi:hypothetical protein CHS0354_027534 [Potamilus streckersoni]|uniref:Uncharacterized protein n=1 Tax=Potamilus streckersoni TaxID=2493646 RepID=A0AAE0S0H9_9BIVA|nr:hypothetical protein CHS0354_027534 [Potamilus streckersoni]